MLSVPRLACVFSLAVALFAVPRSAFAEGPLASVAGTSPVASPPLELGLGAGSAISAGQTCTRLGSDIVGCQAVGIFYGLHLAPQYRFLPHWSLGLRGDFVWAGAQRTTSANWWMARAEGRWHPLDPSGTDLWLGLDAGVVALAQSFQADELGPRDTRTKIAPIFGGGVGVDWALGSSVALGPALRSFFIPLKEDANWLPDRGNMYASQFAVTLEFNVTFLLGGGQKPRTASASPGARVSWREPIASR